MAKKFFTISLICAVFLSPQMMRADSADQIAAQINAFGLIANVQGNNRVYVTGTLTGVTSGLVLTLDGGVDIHWGATISSGSGFTPADGNLISIISASGNNNVTFDADGGAITATGNVTAVYADGATIDVNGGWISAENGTAIHTVHDNATITMAGGTVSATTGVAIQGDGANASIDINGGLVFAYANGSISGPGNAINFPSGGYKGTSSGGLAIAKDTSYTGTYTIGGSEGILISDGPPAYAEWGMKDGVSGIYYSDPNGKNPGFFPVPGMIFGVRVDAETPNLIGPNSATVVQGTQALLSVTATVFDGGTLTYQWYRNTVNSTTGATAISGATSDTYSAPTATVGVMYYYVVVTNTNNAVTGTKTATATSAVVAVTVQQFIPVTNITNVPTTANVNTPLLLTGTVIPTTASFQDIIWSISPDDDGSTGSSISGGNSLKATTVGTVTVRATIADGAAIGTDYIKDFKILVNPEGFVAVTDIINVPRSFNVDQTLALTGTVVPNNATYQDIIWSISDAGSTGATLSGNVLSATATGIVKFTATILNGLGTGLDFVKDFNTVETYITVNPAGTPTTYGLSFLTGTGGNVTSDKAAYEANEAVTLTITTDPGYELNSIKAYKSDETSVAVALSGTGNTRTFNMPAYGVTIQTSFVNPSLNTLDFAKGLLESSLYVVAQEVANNYDQVITWLVGRINSILSNGGSSITVNADDITLITITPAVAGAAETPSGTNGNFTFTVKLTLGGSSVTTKVLPGLIIATAYKSTPPTPTTDKLYIVYSFFSPYGTVTAVPIDPCTVGTHVTLTITPITGYELTYVVAHSFDAEEINVPLAGREDIRTFDMPAFNVVIDAEFKETQAQMDADAIKAADLTVEGGTYSIAQATGNTKATVDAWLVNVLNMLFGDANDVLFRAAHSIVGDVTITAITPAVAGDESTPAGVNGSFKFTVKLANGSSTFTTAEIQGTIVATPFVAVKSINLALDNLTVTITNTGNAATGDLTLTLSGDNAEDFTLPESTVSSITVGKDASVTVEPLADLPEGTYTAILTVSGDGITSAQVVITFEKSATGMNLISQTNALKARIQNGLLHVDGLTAGKPFRVFSIIGTLVHNRIAEGTVADIPLSVRGVYVIQSGNDVVKVAY